MGCLEKSAGSLACAIGKGLVAGFVGTLAITASQMAEMQLTGREPSAAPANVAGKVLGVQPRDKASEQRFSQMVHFGYGTAWGAFRGLLAVLGIKGFTATLLHCTAIVGTAFMMLPAMGEAPPVSEWGNKAIAIDIWHHLVYAKAAGKAYEALDG